MICMPPCGRPSTPSHPIPQHGTVGLVRIVRLLCLGALWAVSTVAAAQTVDVRRFDLSIDHAGAFGTNAARVLKHQQAHVGFSLSYANDELSARRESPEPQFLEHRLRLEAILAAGFTDWLQLALAIPADLHVEGRALDGTSLSRAGLGDLRLIARGALLRPERFNGFGLSLQLDLGIGMGDRALGTDGRVSVSPHLLFEYRSPGGVLAALDLSTKWRRGVDLRGMRMADELRIGVGTEVPFRTDGLFAVAEVALSVGLGGTDSDAPNARGLDTVAELIAGVRWRGPYGLVVTTGAGTPIVRGAGTPEVRGLLTLGWTSDAAEAPEPEPAATAPEGGRSAEVPPLSTDADMTVPIAPVPPPPPRAASFRWPTAPVPLEWGDTSRSRRSLSARPVTSISSTFWAHGGRPGAGQGPFLLSTLAGELSLAQGRLGLHTVIPWLSLPLNHNPVGETNFGDLELGIRGVVVDRPDVAVTPGLRVTAPSGRRDSGSASERRSSWLIEASTTVAWDPHRLVTLAASHALGSTPEPGGRGRGYYSAAHGVTLHATPRLHFALQLDLLVPIRGPDNGEAATALGASATVDLGRLRVGVFGGAGLGETSRRILGAYSAGLTVGVGFPGI